MVAYIATFADGTTKKLKNSKRDYRAAWRVQIIRTEGGEAFYMDGFSRDAATAHKAASSETAFFRNQPRSRNRYAWADWKPAHFVGPIEVVEAKIVPEGF